MTMTNKEHTPCLPKMSDQDCAVRGGGYNMRNLNYHYSPQTGVFSVSQGKKWSFIGLDFNKDRVIDAFSARNMGARRAEKVKLVASWAGVSVPVLN